MTIMSCDHVVTRPVVLATLLAAGFAGASTSAVADVTAVYQMPTGVMTLEVRSNGDTMGQVGAAGAQGGFVIRGGEAFFVQPQAQGCLVDRADELAAAMADVAERRWPGFKEELGKANGALDTFPHLTARGEVTINGRIGTAYYFAFPITPPKEVPVVVISHDPALAPLGQAAVRMFEFSTMMSQIMGAGPSLGLFDQIKEVLKTGAPLMYAGAELTSANEAPIPASHFDLPCEPENADQIRKRLEHDATADRVVGFPSRP
jgi:hypothetical protein